MNQIVEDYPKQLAEFPMLIKKYRGNVSPMSPVDSNLDTSETNCKSIKAD